MVTTNVHSVFQNQDVCFHLIRPSRGQQVIKDVMDGHEPEIWVSDLYWSEINGVKMS